MITRLLGSRFWRSGAFISALVGAVLLGGLGCDGGITRKGGHGGGGGGGAGAAGVGGDSAGGQGGGVGGTSAGGTGVGGGAPAAGGAGGQGSTVCTSKVIPLPPTGCPDVAGAPLGVAEHPDEGASHAVICSSVCYKTMPPSSGNHYGTWPIYKTYDQPVPWGFLVHGLEHGAVIVSYNCPCGCPDEVAAAQAWIDALLPDAKCAARPRVVLAPDPTLDVRWAASAWTWTLRAQAFDPVAFDAFFNEHYDRASESICGGATDGSAAGWCN